MCYDRVTKQRNMYVVVEFHDNAAVPVVTSVHASLDAVVVEWERVRQTTPERRPYVQFVAKHSITAAGEITHVSYSSVDAKYDLDPHFRLRLPFS